MGCIEIGADQVVAQVLRDLEGQRLRDRRQSDLCVQGVEQFGNGATRELNVHDGTDDPDDAAGEWPTPLALFVGYCCGHVSQSLPALEASAFAPPTISLISWVIWAWRAWFA